MGRWYGAVLGGAYPNPNPDCPRLGVPLAAEPSLGLWAHTPVPLQTAPLPLGAEWAAGSPTRLRHRDGRLPEALVAGHDSPGLVGCAGPGGLGGTLSPGGWLL